GPDMPLVAHMLHLGEPAFEQAQQQDVSKPPPSPVVAPHPSPDLMPSPPKPSSPPPIPFGPAPTSRVRIATLEAELKATKILHKDTLVLFAKRIKKLESKLKTKKEIGARARAATIIYKRLKKKESSSSLDFTDAEILAGGLDSAGGLVSASGVDFAGGLTSA
nr:hypothetical protein [Tanacetum cinerariifolium]